MAMNNMSHNEVQEDNRDDEEDMSDQGTEGHVIKPPNIHQPLDQGNGNSLQSTMLYCIYN